jgi:hypothetical protein
VRCPDYHSGKQAKILHNVELPPLLDLKEMYSKLVGIYPRLYGLAARLVTLELSLLPGTVCAGGVKEYQPYMIFGDVVEGVFGDLQHVHAFEKKASSNLWPRDHV